MNQALTDVHSDMVDCLFRYIDRMNDYCDVDPAERILDQFTKAMEPLFKEYFEVAHGVDSVQQLRLEFRSPEEIEADEARLRARRRPVRLRVPQPDYTLK